MMKTSALVVAGLLLSAALLPAQGTVNFNNRVINVGGVLPSVDAPIYDLVVGGVMLEGSSYLAQLYSGPAGTTEDKLVATGAIVEFRAGLAAGYINNLGDGSRTVPNVVAGDYAVLQVRAWSAAAGSTYEQALNSTSPTAKAGKSSMLTVQTSASVGGLPAFPVDMVGLQSFAITPVPEPAVFGLGALGLMLLAFRARARR